MAEALSAITKLVVVEAIQEDEGDKDVLYATMRRIMRAMKV